MASHVPRLLILSPRDTGVAPSDGRSKHGDLQGTINLHFNTHERLILVQGLFYYNHGFSIQVIISQFILSTFDASSSLAIASMATSMESEKYEVLETIGKDSTLARQIWDYGTDSSYRSRILWHNQKGQKNIRRSCKLLAQRL